MGEARRARVLRHSPTAARQRRQLARCRTCASSGSDLHGSVVHWVELLCHPRRLLPARARVCALPNRTCVRWRTDAGVRVVHALHRFNPEAKTMNVLLRSALVAAGLGVATQATAQIAFYEHDNFGGRSFTAERQMANFERTGFNDRASSVVVMRDRW